jgi:hypothetical protein
MNFAKDLLGRAKDAVQDFQQRANSAPQPLEAQSAQASTLLPNANIGSIQSVDARVSRFKQELLGSTINVHSLKRLAFHGVPDKDSLRATVWKLLLGYLPPNPDEWAQSLAKRRTQYHVFCDVSHQWVDLHGAHACGAATTGLLRVGVGRAVTICAPQPTFAAVVSARRTCRMMRLVIDHVHVRYIVCV